MLNLKDIKEIWPQVVNKLTKKGEDAYLIDHKIFEWCMVCPQKTSPV